MVCVHLLPGGETVLSEPPQKESVTASNRTRQAKCLYCTNWKVTAMAEQKKPTSPARKKPVKRGPTKATALKTLGLDAEDLKLLAQLKEARAQAAEPAPEVAEVKTTVPDEVTNPPKTTDYSATDGEDGPWFIRNLRNVEVHFRLGRQEGQTKKRTNLEPRGKRGDILKIENADLTDENLITQVSYGLIEIITAAEAKKAIDGQAVNQQQAVHPAMAMLRNELNQPYKQTEVPVVGDNSYTVAHLTPQGGEAGALPGQGRGVDWNAIHAGNAGIGGNPAIVSDGFAQPPEVAADVIARRKDIEGPAAGLGGVTVTVEPTQRT